ncbi:CHAT domain-containing protein [Actinoplanes derwentensis]|uniref:CHAT domain-containing protein n=1 Tax=Actinoplanes derwentensis TaxID=113562 RepID=A0A1H1WUW5_9ACTN|nr:CHAT domain-containing protein [Actinoplanes derwentensis]GID86964.1 CHAT domain-containing protein [Actinoplanes derwentensis]SDT00914.1 CHAT domain-containing protein [Actinoplanes derwentensis]
MATVQERADAAMRLVQTDPRLARAEALRVRTAARRAGDAGAESAAERVLGLAGRESNNVASAARHLRRAVALADAAGLPVAAARARMTLALVRADQGDIAEAMSLGEAAAPYLEGLEAARLGHQLALVAQRRGLFREALRGYGSALAVFRREGDLHWEARVRNNRGVLHAYRGHPGPAETDLRRAEELYAALGQDLAVADVRWNRGFAAGRDGRVVTALTHLAAAEDHYVQHHLSPAMIMMDRCDVLLSAGLYEEARDVATAAVRELTRRRMTADLAEARLLLAAAALACGDLTAARHAARLAERAFTRQGRPGWATVAGYTRLRTDWTAGRPRPALLRAAVAGAAALRDAGWAAPAADAALIAARCALAAGRPGEATELLRHTARARRPGYPAALRVSAWHAMALLRIAGGDRRGAEAALRAGLRALDEHRLTLGATELRVRAAEHGFDLVMTALRLAVSAGSARSLLIWAERGRAAAQQLRPAGPPQDPGLAEEFAELRAVAAVREQALAEGRDARRHQLRQAHLERSIRDRVRRTHPATPVARAGALRTRTLTEHLAGRALIELITVDDTLHAVVLAGGRLTRRELGPVGAVNTEIRALRFALHRMSLRDRTGPSGADRLDRMLLAPLRPLIGNAGLVIVASGRLHGVPWRMLPTCADRTVSVAPSAVAWLRAASAAPSGEGTVLVAGPGLPGAADEIKTLGVRYGTAHALAGDQARVPAVLHAMDGAARTHIAAHGTFRADNPQFSTLGLADGPLTVYDLETLNHPPDLVVLSACDSGLSTVHRGDEIMGFAAALLALGTRSVIATVAPVRDGAARDVMVRLHDRLRAGSSPSVALAEAQWASRGDPAASAFICHGAG